MENLSQWWEAFVQSFTTSFTNIGAYLPALVAAIALMLLGWFVAHLLRAGCRRLEGTTHRLVQRFSPSATAATRQVTRRIVALTANFVFWITVLLFAALAARVAGLDAFSGWLDRVVEYVPTLLAGLLIAFAGYLLSTLVRDIVSTALVSVGSRENEIAGFAAQSTVFLTALVIGLDQIGIDVTFLIIVVAVLLGGALLSIALAFGFGARDFVGNLIAAHQVQSVLRPGDLARVGDVEGRIVEITATSIMLTNDDGRFLIPASQFQKQTAAILPVDFDE